MIHKTSLISGAAGLAVMEQIPTPQVDTHLDLVLKTIVAIASLIPTILNIFRKKPKQDTKAVETPIQQNSDSTQQK